MTLPPPILAAGFEGLVAIAFLVISVIGWVINQAGGQKPQAPNPGAAARPQPKRQQIQSEIDSFLQQATGNRPARGNAGKPVVDDIEVIEEPRRVAVAPERRPPARQQPKPVTQPARQQPSRPQPQAARPPQQTARPQPQPVRTSTTPLLPRTMPTALGQGVRQHVATHMADQISQHVAQEVPHAIDAMVQQHLGASSSGNVFAQQESLAASIGAELQNVHAIRNAIIMNEILSPPVSRRNNRV